MATVTLSQGIEVAITQAVPEIHPRRRRHRPRLRHQPVLRAGQEVARRAPPLTNHRAVVPSDHLRDRDHGRRRPRPAVRSVAHRAGPVLVQGPPTAPGRHQHAPRWQRHSHIGARAVDHCPRLIAAHRSPRPRSEPRLTEPSARCQARRTARHPQLPEVAPAPRRAAQRFAADRPRRAAPCNERHENSSARGHLRTMLSDPLPARRRSISSINGLASTVPHHGSDSSCATPSPNLAASRAPRPGSGAPEGSMCALTTQRWRSLFRVTFGWVGLRINLQQSSCTPEGSSPFAYFSRRSIRIGWLLPNRSGRTRGPGGCHVARNTSSPTKSRASS